MSASSIQKHYQRTVLWKMNGYYKGKKLHHNSNVLYGENFTD